MFELFAHAGEDHGSTAESTEHLLSSWYVALPLFLLVVAGAAAIAYLISKRSLSATYLTIVAIFLVSGLFLYDKSPVISTVAITFGLLGSVIVVLTSLAGPLKKSSKR